MNVQIKFNGKDCIFTFNEFAHRKIMSTIFYDIEKGFATTESEINASTITATFYGGLLGTYYQERKAIDFTFSDVVNWLENTSKEDVEKVCNVYAETQRYKDFVEQLGINKKEIAVEKKSTRKKKSINIS